MDKQMLAGKVALITVASYGMGQSMAELFSDEGAAGISNGKPDLIAWGRNNEE